MHTWARQCALGRRPPHAVAHALCQVLAFPASKVFYRGREVAELGGSAVYAYEVRHHRAHRYTDARIYASTHLRIHTSTHPCIHASTHAHAQVINQLLTMRDEIIVAERAVEAGLRVERAGAS